MTSKRDIFDFVIAIILIIFVSLLVLTGNGNSGIGEVLIPSIISGVMGFFFGRSGTASPADVRELISAARSEGGTREDRGSSFPQN